jgi:hypothetical protein
VADGDDLLAHRIGHTHHRITYCVCGASDREQECHRRTRLSSRYEICALYDLNLPAVRKQLKNYEMMKRLMDRWIDLATELSNPRLKHDQT